MLYILISPLFTYCSGVFGNGDQQLSCLLCKIVITKPTVTSFFCFICGAEFGVPNLFLSSTVCALQSEGRHRAKGKVSISLSRKMKANIVKRGVPVITNDSEVRLFALYAFARASGSDWEDEKTLSRYLHGYALAMITAVSEWKPGGSRRVCYGNAMSDAVYLKVAP